MLSDPGPASQLCRYRCLVLPTLGRKKRANDDNFYFGAQSHGQDARCLRFPIQFPYTGKTRFRLVDTPLPGGIRTHRSPSASFKIQVPLPYLFKSTRFILAPPTSKIGSVSEPHIPAVRQPCFQVGPEILKSNLSELFSTAVRVERSVSRPSPHRTVRADFPHTVPQMMDLLCK
jgi:hypothetical protein